MSKIPFRLCPGIEILEARIAPATFNISGGAATYTAGAGIANVLTVASPSSNYTFTDTAETITLGAGAIAAGFTGSGTNTITGPNTAVSSMNILLGDLGDTLTLNGLDDRVTADGQAGTDTITVASTIDGGAGAVSLTAETLTANGAIFSGALTLSADTMSIGGGGIQASGRVILQPSTAGRPINIGTEVAGQLSLTAGELALINGAVLQIGNAAAGAITVSAAFTLSASTLALLSGSTVGQTAALTIPELRVSSSGAVTLNNAGNDVATVAIRVTTAGADVSFRDANDFVIGTVDGLSGIETTLTGDTVTLRAGNGVTQAAGADLATTFLELLGTGAFTLSNPGNDIVDLAANITGPLTFTDIDPINIGLAGGTAGITTNNNPITVATINGNINVFNNNGTAAADVNAGTAAVSITAGSTGLANNQLVIAADAGITGTGGVTLVADNISLGAAINAGTATALLRPSQAGTLINLGGADAANTLGLTDAELDFVTAGSIDVGAADSGNLTVTAAIAPAASAQLVLFTGGSVAQNAGANLLMTRLGISAATAITLGNAGNTFANFEAETVNGTITALHTGTLNIGGVTTAIDGVQVTTSGDITISNTGSVILNGSATEDIRAANGDVVVAAGGATSDIETRNDSADAIDSNLGNVTLAAGRDILFGSATDDDFGDVEANGNLTLTAGRDIIVDENTFVDVTGTGSIAATAGRHFSLVASDGTTGARVTTEGGDITISLGVGGIFTATPGGGGAAMDSSRTAAADGDITVTANDIAITQALTAGTGAVTLKSVSAARPTDLGTETVGALSLTAAEIGLINAATLRVGDGTAGPLTVSAAVTRSGATIATELFATGNITVGAALTLSNATFAAPFVNVTSTGALSASGTATGPILVQNGGLLAPGTSPGLLAAAGVSLAAGATFNVELNGATAGTQYDQLAINGTVNLGGATLNVAAGFTPGFGNEFIIIGNDGNDAVIGTFAGLDEGEVFALNGSIFSISYAGGVGGNDVTLSVVPLGVTLSNAGRTATFIDRDGDIVTVKTSKGAFDGSEFLGIQTDLTGGGQLQTLKLDADFAGANITMTAKPGPNGGNGFVNLGFLDATGVNLGVVTISGDLGRISAGTVGGDAKVPGVKSLSARSMGLLGTSTQGAGGSDASVIEGALPKLALKEDLRADLRINGATDGKLGSVTIGGALAEGVFGNARIEAEAGIGSLKIGGDIRGNVTILSGGAIGAINVGGSIARNPGGTTTVTIGAFGQLTAPAKGIDLAIKSLTVRGTVEFTNIQAGITKSNADASIGSIVVGGDWIASSVQAGSGGGDGLTGNADDAQITGGRDAAEIFSTIGSFTVKGQAVGTATTTADMFGVVAERIGKAKIGARTFAFIGGSNEAFFAAPTLDGAGAENPMFDFAIREIGALAPAGTISGGVALTLSADGKSATFFDVDGDAVTLKRSAGTFALADFDLPAQSSGGGQLRKLTLTAAPDNAAFNLTITATPGPDGGNGFVNIGEIVASGLPVGTVSIAGDLARFNGGSAVGAKPGVAALSAHSVGLLGTATGAADTISSFVGGLGKLTIAADARGAQFIANGTGAGIASVAIGGAFAASSVVSAEGNIGSVKIGGSMRGGELRASKGAIGAISIGGDLLGTGSNPAIYAFGQLTAPAKGLDTAIKSLTVKGNVENARIEAGTGSTDTNADASIGSIQVGRAWIASSVLAGADAGPDSFLGTADDTKDLGAVTTRDVATRFSTIAKIVIKGQAFGTPGAGDHFGIVAEQINAAKVGARAFKLIKDERDAEDAFAIAPTGPGAGVLPFDFFLREIF